MFDNSNCVIKDDDDGRIIVFVKKNLCGYQLYPRPTSEEKGDFLEYKIDYPQELSYKQFIFNSAGEVLFVDNPPNPADCYSYDFASLKWIEDAEKKAQYDEEQNKLKKEVLIKKIKEQMEPLQLAIELDMATEEEKEKLLALKKQLVEANRM